MTETEGIKSLSILDPWFTKIVTDAINEAYEKAELVTSLEFLITAFQGEFELWDDNNLPHDHPYVNTHLDCAHILHQLRITKTLLGQNLIESEVAFAYVAAANAHLIKIQNRLEPIS